MKLKKLLFIVLCISFFSSYAIAHPPPQKGVWKSVGGSATLRGGMSYGTETTIADADTDPSVKGDVNFVTAATAGTTIDGFDDGIDGQEIAVRCVANWTFDFTTSNLVGNGGADYTVTAGDLLKFYTPDGTTWYSTFIGKAAGGAGEINTASNVGTAGTGVFYQKSTFDLEFKKINSGFGITITDDVANTEVDVEVSDAELVALGGLTSAANALPYFTGSGTADVTTLSAYMRGLLDDADEATLHASINLEIGTDVQTQDAELEALSGLTSAADKGIQFTGVGTAATYDLTAYAKTLLDDADEATLHATINLEIGTDVQAWSATLDTVTASTYAGDNAIVTVGTIGTGVWQGTVIDMDYTSINALDTAITSRDNTDKIAVWDTGAAGMVYITVGNFVTGLGGGGSAIVFDIGDDGGDDSTDLAEIATSGDTNSVITLDATDKMLINMALNWPTADEADTLSTFLTHELGGMEVSVAGYTTGLFGMISDTTTDIDTPAELETAAGLGAFFNEYADDADASTMRSTLSAQLADGDLDSLATPTTWVMFYSDGSQNIAELALGADNTFLVSTGAAALPEMRVLAAGDLPTTGTWDMSSMTMTFGLVAGDIPGTFLENLSEDTTPDLGGNLGVGANEIQSTGDIVLQLGDNAAVYSFEIEDSDGSTIFTVDSNGVATYVASDNPYMMFNEDDASPRFALRHFDTTTDVMQIGTSTSSPDVQFTMVAEVDGSGNFNVIGGYEINGTQIDLADLSDGAAHAAYHVDGGADELDGDLIDIDYAETNYTPATTGVATDINDLAAHLEGIDDALGASAAGTFLALTDTTIATPLTGQVAIYDGSDSWDNKNIQSPFALDSSGNLTVVAHLTIGDYNLTNVGDIALDSISADLTNVLFGSAAATQLQFRDTAIYVASLTDGHLDLMADVSIDLNTAADTDLVLNFAGTTSSGVITWMEDEDTMAFADVLANTPVSKTYSADDDSETIGVDILSSIVMVTGDNDSTDETVDLQDGSVNGQMVTFIALALIDSTDDAFILDVETDSTCSGCPTAGIFTLETIGDSVSLIWHGTAWFHAGSYIQ